MLDFNSCYAYLRSSNASEEQGLWLQLLLSAPAVGYRRVAVQPPESAAHNRYLNRWMAHDSTRQPKVRGRNWVIHVSSPCFVHEKIWLPPPHLYIYIYCRSVLPTKKLPGSAWNSSPWPHRNSQKNPGWPTCNTETSFSLVEWDPGWTGGIFGSSKKCRFCTRGFILSGFHALQSHHPTRSVTDVKSWKERFCFELLLEASSRHLIH